MPPRSPDIGVQLCCRRRKHGGNVHEICDSQIPHTYHEVAYVWFRVEIREAGRLANWWNNCIFELILGQLCCVKRCIVSIWSLNIPIHKPKQTTSYPAPHWSRYTYYFLNSLLNNTTSLSNSVPLLHLRRKDLELAMPDGVKVNNSNESTSQL